MPTRIKALTIDFNVSGDLSLVQGSHQALSLKLLRQCQPGKLHDSRSYVEQSRRGRHAIGKASCPHRPMNDQRHVQRALVNEVAVRAFPMVAETLAVV